MSGLFNNETGLYEPVTWFDEESDWFTESPDNHPKNERFLYIVPWTTDAECDGPDNEMMDEINACCRYRGRLTDEDVKRLDLVRIPDHLKRFNPHDGYYTC